jgi:pyruvate formate lyase activating enzyme
MATVLKHADLVYFDLKHPDPALHLALMGAPLDVVLGNLRSAAQSGAALTIRVPLIPECNNDAATLLSMAKLAKEIAPNATVHILPYHKYGESKYASVGMAYTLDALRENTPEELEVARAIFAGQGFTCEVV